MTRRERMEQRQKAQMVKAQKKYENYLAAKERNTEIRAWIKGNDLYDFEEVMDRLEIEKPEWYKALCWSDGSQIVILKYCRKRSEERWLAEARKEVHKDKPNTRKAKPVICVDNGMEFPSINAVAKWLGRKRTQDISDCCYGIIEEVAGLHFKFKD